MHLSDHPYLCQLKLDRSGMVVASTKEQPMRTTISLQYHFRKLLNYCEGRSCVTSWMNNHKDLTVLLLVSHAT